MSEHREWYSRGYLPHCDLPGKIQSVTIRLNDSMPTKRREEWAHLIERGEGSEIDDLERRRLIEAYLDAGYGTCHLQQAEIGRMVEDSLLHWDGVRYRMLAWVVMPNHLHMVFEMVEGWPLGELMRRFKSYTGHSANRLLRASGRFWYPDYWDRYVRDVDHLHRVMRYTHQNPVAARLVSRAEDWPFSSARFEARTTLRTPGPDGRF